MLFVCRLRRHSLCLSSWCLEFSVREASFVHNLKGPFLPPTLHASKCCRSPLRHTDCGKKRNLYYPDFRAFKGIGEGCGDEVLPVHWMWYLETDVRGTPLECAIKFLAGFGVRRHFS